MRTVRIKMVSSSIQICYDDQNNKYDLPVFIINPPARFEVKQESDGNYDGKRIKIKLQYLGDMSEVEMSLDDPASKLLAVATEMVKKAETFDPTESMIRLIYQGKMLKTDAKLGAYLKSDSIVQVFKTIKPT